ncbi:MAG: glutathione peroxidase [Saprospiraceae bacterium]|nr:glutathione peroxidase [Saprospiraceae bacterium]
MHSIHQFKVAGIEGEEIDFAQFKGKKIMVVNVASECGFTPQYQQLQELYEEFQDKLMIVGFPSNDFGGQEPGTNEEIRAFCTRRYGVSFPLTAKITIKGSNMHPVYQWLTQKTQNGVANSEVQWNFYKYLLDESGHLVKNFSSVVSPLDDEILGWLQS